MFCTNCGQELQEDALFCTNCGQPVNDRSKNNTVAWSDLGLYSVSILSALTGLTKWIQISVPFVDELNGSFHLWSLVSLLRDVGKLAESEELARLSVVVAIPLVCWVAGIIMDCAAGGLMLAKKKRAAGICFGVSSGSMLMSGGIYLALVYRLKAQINNRMKEAVGLAIGGNLIKVPLWPWLMTVFGIAGIALTAYGQYRQVHKSVSGSEGAAVPVDTMPGLRQQPSPAAPGLVVLQDVHDASRIYGCDLAKPVVAGRDAASCNIVIEGDKSISRQHCRFVRNGMACYVEDLNSYNHTYVNGIMITGAVPLRAGDQLRLGNLELLVLECDMAKSL